MTDTERRSFEAGRSPAPRLVRVLGAASVALQIAILWVITGDTAVGVSLSVLLWAAAIGLRLPGAKWLRGSPFYVALFGVLLLKLNFAPYDIGEFRGYLGTNLAFEFATYLMLAQTAMLFGFSGGGLPPIFNAAGGLSIFLLSDIQADQRGQLMMLAAVLTFVTLMIAQFRLGRRAFTGERVGWLPLLTSSALALGMGGGVAFGLAKYNRAIERSLMSVMGMAATRASTGFNTTGDLTTVSEWRAADDGRIALRVYADDAPGYLNGQSMAVYNGYRWQNPTETQRPVGAVEHPDRLPEPDFGSIVFATEGHTTFRAAEDAPGGRAAELPEGVEPDVPPEPDALRMEVWPGETREETYFRPPGQAFIAADTPSLQLDPFGNAFVDEEFLGDPYTTYAVSDEGSPESGLPVDLRPWQREIYLSLPGAMPGLPSGQKPKLLSVLDATLDRAFGRVDREGLTPREKAALVEEYFRENYTYRLGSDTAPEARRDKTEWFLSERSEGHCEFFASATCLLLRKAGVPTRYAVGFVVEEENTVGGYWLARNKDAHAWCEAYDDATKRWFVVESTPAAGIPAPADTGGWPGIADALRLAIRRSQAKWQQRDLKAEIAAASSQLTSPTTLLAIGLMAGAAAGWLRYRQRGQEGRPELRQLSEILSRFERFAGRHGHPRAAEETLRQYASRVRHAGVPWADEADRWIRDYSVLRYRTAASEPPAATAVAELRRDLARLKSVAKR